MAPGGDSAFAQCVPLRLASQGFNSRPAWPRLSLLDQLSSNKTAHPYILGRLRLAAASSR
jgi:hypothetical protein